MLRRGVLLLSTPLADSALADLALTDPALADPALADLALADSALTDLALTDSALTDSALADSALADSTLADLPLRLRYRGGLLKNWVLELVDWGSQDLGWLNGSELPALELYQSEILVLTLRPCKSLHRRGDDGSALNWLEPWRLKNWGGEVLRGCSLDHQSYYGDKCKDFGFHIYILSLSSVMTVLHPYCSGRVLRFDEFRVNFMLTSLGG